MITIRTVVTESIRSQILAFDICLNTSLWLIDVKVGDGKHK